ncbi:MAG: hypothetical protein ABSG15_13605 [FCB group bacterium]|jgi:hypothetical protein
MKWYHYIACFFAGAFLANFVPHFVMGISGMAFTSPFASPPGKGMSAPYINVLWGFFNLVIGYILFRAGKVQNKNFWALLVFFAGILLMGLNLSITFAGLHH